MISNIGPNSEVLHSGNLGLLIDKPNFINSWVEAINNVLENEIDFNKENLDLLKLYDFSQWSKEIKKIEIKLIKSPIGYNLKKKNTLEALGLKKMNKKVVKNADKAILGMIKQVFHLVEVKEI